MKPEQAALLRKAESSLKAARLLASEAYHDFAASRAYYAMFYAAEALLLGAGLYTVDQLERKGAKAGGAAGGKTAGELKPNQVPSRGVIEVKSTG